MPEKTPDEIKKGLEMYLSHSEEECAYMCRDSECPYKEPLSPNGGSCGDLIRSDALAYIQQLEAANAELLTKVEHLEAKCHQLERERDAAVETIKEETGCRYCAKYTFTEDYVSNDCLDCINKCNWEWRGVKEE